jgi:phage terminase large subunit-like protein
MYGATIKIPISMFFARCTRPWTEVRISVRLQGLGDVRAGELGERASDTDASRRQAADWPSESRHRRLTTTGSRLTARVMAQTPHDDRPPTDRSSHGTDASRRQAADWPPESWHRRLTTTGRRLTVRVMAQTPHDDRPPTDRPSHGTDASRRQAADWPFESWQSLVRNKPENCVLLCYCTASSGDALPTFRYNLSVPSLSYPWRWDR